MFPWLSTYISCPDNIIQKDRSDLVKYYVCQIRHQLHTHVRNSTTIRQMRVASAFINRLRTVLTFFSWNSNIFWLLKLCREHTELLYKCCVYWSPSHSRIQGNKGYGIDWVYLYVFSVLCTVIYGMIIQVSIWYRTVTPVSMLLWIQHCDEICNKCCLAYISILYIIKQSTCYFLVEVFLIFDFF